MHARQPVPQELLQLASLQAGVVSREQALGHGLGRHAVTRLLRDGAWQRLSSGIYFTSTSAPSWPSLAWGGVLIGGDAARLGGRAAAYRYRLLEEAPSTITVLVPECRAAPDVPGPWAFQRERAGLRQLGSRGSPPCLCVEDTVLDLVNGAEEREAISYVTAAVQQRLTTPDRLREALTRRPRIRHRALLQHLVADVAEGARSPLELAYLRDVERPHGLPKGQRQLRRRRTEVDVLYEKYALLVELDGRRGHDDVGRFRDMRRDNVSTTDGLATLRYGQRDVFGIPCPVAWQVGANLELRGWPGPLLRCRRCQKVPDLATALTDLTAS